MSVPWLFCSFLRLNIVRLSPGRPLTWNIMCPQQHRDTFVTAIPWNPCWLLISCLTQCRNSFCRLKWLYTYSGLASLYLPAQLLPFSGPKSTRRQRVYKMAIFLLCLYSPLDNVWHNICVQVTQPQTLGRNQRKSHKTSYAEPEKKKMEEWFDVRTDTNWAGMSSSCSKCSFFFFFNVYIDTQ